MFRDEYAVTPKFVSIRKMCIQGVVTEIMGITPDGYKALEQMEKA